MTPTDPGERLLELGREALALVIDPGNRTHWLALLSALAIACALLGWRSRRGDSAIGDELRAAVTRLRSPSARVDLGYVLIRPIVAALLITPWIATALGVAIATTSALRRGFGQAPDLGLSTTAVTLLFTLVLFVAWDASRFALHWAMHRSAVLWQFHQVHHGAETLNPFTLYRVHPVERILYRLRGVLVTGGITGVFYFAFGGPAIELQLLGVNALGLAFNVAGGNLRHSHVRWSWGALERVFISPAQHQMHHERHDLTGGSLGDARISGSNLGTWLAVWDRLLGTWEPSAGARPVAFGLSPEALNHRPDGLLSSLFDPCTAALRVMVERRRIVRPRRPTAT